MTVTDNMVEAGARAICIAVGDDPDQMTYAREMHCTGNDRELQYRWQFWSEHSRAAIVAAATADLSPVVTPGERS